MARIHKIELYKKELNDPDNHDVAFTHLEPDILKSEVRWALGSITTNEASGGDGIPADLFQVLEDGAVKVLHSICQQIWKIQQWPQDWKILVFIPIYHESVGLILKYICFNTESEACNSLLLQTKEKSYEHLIDANI